ncbi:ras-domain-containing protein [Xylona heveae TC161]|uniref:Ras-domain-containing protein n=1 Tax=Xylona heveae (strain CBS 132557 / TC161) TaxID=1328760 RepID=A0A165GB47_XYLHT|nr:ras-domain-containing protein [Xylona heveae TC161]KZF21974.1 ras-domain-containing protein [Xylona heveae TC161]
MLRQRAPSNVSTDSSLVTRDQELGSMYDYLAKIILLGPSGTGKCLPVGARATPFVVCEFSPPKALTSDISTKFRSCLLHRFVKSEWRVLSSQTIGVEFSSKVVKVGTGARRKRIKLQLWDTAGTERFRSVSRSYYRGAAGALLVYDLASHASFEALPTFLSDARALASPNLTMILVGNKADLSSSDDSAAQYQHAMDGSPPMGTPSSLSSKKSLNSNPYNSIGSSSTFGVGARNSATIAPEGREVSPEEASRWASSCAIPVSAEVSALSGDNVDEIFARLARMILTKIELGEIDPDDPQSGIQYGDSGSWGFSDGGTTGSKSRGNDSSAGSTRRVNRGRRRTNTNGWMTGVREWEEVFRLDSNGRRRRGGQSGGCC